MAARYMGGDGPFAGYRILATDHKRCLPGEMRVKVARDKDPQTGEWKAVWLTVIEKEYQPVLVSPGGETIGD